MRKIWNLSEQLLAIQDILSADYKTRYLNGIGDWRCNVDLQNCSDLGMRLQMSLEFVASTESLIILGIRYVLREKDSVQMLQKLRDLKLNLPPPLFLKIWRLLVINIPDPYIASIYSLLDPTLFFAWFASNKFLVCGRKISFQRNFCKQLRDALVFSSP